MPWNSLNTLKTPAKKAGGGGITLSFDVPANVVTNTVTGWTVYTIKGNVVATATVTRTTNINILAVGGGGAGGGSSSRFGGGGGGGRFLEITKTINVVTPTQTITCIIPNVASKGSFGGNTMVNFSDINVGNIYSGGGGVGSSAYGLGWVNAQIGGGSGGGGSGGGGSSELGGIAQNGYNGGMTNNYSNSGGGGGGSGGAGKNSINNYGGGSGIAPTLAGINLVYTTATFCGGGGGAANVSGGGSAGCTGAGAGTTSNGQTPTLTQNATGYGCGGGGVNVDNTIYGKGGPGAVIIAVPA